MIAAVLWQLLKEEWIADLSKDGSAGHEFENRVLERVYSALRSLNNFYPHPPRTTLALPTISGLTHQIDVIVREGSNTYHLIECKFTRSADIEELYALCAKLMDYSLAAYRAKHNHIFRGYFLSGRGAANQNYYQYATAWGITLVIPDGLPPVEYILQKTPRNVPLYSSIEKLKDLTSGADVKKLVSQQKKADELLATWRTLHLQWKNDGYDI